MKHGLFFEELYKFIHYRDRRRSWSKCGNVVVIGKEPVERNIVHGISRSHNLDNISSPHRACTVNDAAAAPKCGEMFN